MRLKAPPGAGDPSVGGVTITPNAKGIYEVDAGAGAVLVESHGFTDLDAPKKSQPPAGAAPSDSALRDAVAKLLKSAGIAVAGSNDAILAEALGGLNKKVDEHVSAQVKATEDRVLGEFSAELTAAKERADKAEASVAALTARAETAEAELAKLKPKA